MAHPLKLQRRTENGWTALLLAQRRCNMTKLRQGEIILTRFDPVKGHEQSGYRPALVVMILSKAQ